MIQLSDQLLELTRQLELQGADIGAESLRLRVSNSRDVGQSQRIALEQLLPTIAANDNQTLATVLDNTLAKTFEDLSADLAFAQLFDDLVAGASQFTQAARELDRQFTEASRSAQRLGLDESLLAEARARASQELLFQAQEQLFGLASQLQGAFEAQLGPLRSALDQINFGGSSGLSVGNQLTIAQERFDAEIARFQSGQTVDTDQIADLGIQVVDLARQFTGGAGGFEDLRSEIVGSISDVVASVEDRRRSLEERLDASLAEIADEVTRARRVEEQQVTRLDRLIDEVDNLSAQLRAA